MRRVICGMLVGALMASGAPVAWAHGDEEHAAHEPSAAAGERVLTGEVVDVTCYLSHGAAGLGAGHAECARKCIKGGLPVAIRADGRLYLAAMADHTPANAKLHAYAGQQVEVHGKVLEADGQPMVVISHIEAP